MNERLNEWMNIWTTDGRKEWMNERRATLSPEVACRIPYLPYLLTCLLVYLLTCSFTYLLTYLPVYLANYLEPSAYFMPTHYLPSSYLPTCLLTYLTTYLLRTASIFLLAFTCQLVISAFMKLSIVAVWVIFLGQRTSYLGVERWDIMHLPSSKQSPSP